MKKILLYLFIQLIVIHPLLAQKKHHPQRDTFHDGDKAEMVQEGKWGEILRAGDLIFQESCDHVGMGDAIKDVTSGIFGYSFTHVGLVSIDQASDSIFVIEATHPQVRITPINQFVKPEDKDCVPRMAVGRLKPSYRHLIPQAIEEAKKLVGKDYDDAFDLANDKYYCSELVYDVFLKANHKNQIGRMPTASLDHETLLKKGVDDSITDKARSRKSDQRNTQSYLPPFAVFRLNKMTFKSPQTNTFSPYWIKHFKKLGVPVPEGEWGINPNAMSTQSDVIDIISLY